MKSKSLYLPLFLSVCLSISQSLSLFSVSATRPPQPRPARSAWSGQAPSGLFCFFVALLPPFRPSHTVGCSHAWGIHSIFTIYYYYCYYYKTKHNCIGPWILGILGEGDHSTHCSRPADIHQIEVFLLLTTYILLYWLLPLLFHLPLFNTLVFFWPKNIPAPARGLFLPCLNSLSIQRWSLGGWPHRDKWALVWLWRSTARMRT